MNTLFIALQAILPQHTLTRLVGHLAALERPTWLKNALIRLFMMAYGIRLDEAMKSEPEDYVSFNDFFTRALKPAARPKGDAAYLMPADGVLSQRGTVDAGQIIQAKGRWFDVQTLLGCDSGNAEHFDNGSFATVYLSPKDYHRVHMPISGTLRRTRYIPGDLFAVNKTTTEGVDALFARNERLVCEFDTADGRVAVVLVGAIIVAGIATVWGGREMPQPADIRERQFDAENAPTLAAGDELGRFFLGSTVVVVSERSHLQWTEEAGASVQVNADLASH